MHDVQVDVNETANGNQEQSPPFIYEPIMVYDGNCNFCKFWVSRWQRHTSGTVSFKPYQQLPKLYFGITHQQFSKSVYLITQYRRLRGAAAVFEVLALGGNDFWNSLYYNVVLADTISEACYRFIAAHRDFFFWLTKLFYKEARHFDAEQTILS